MSRPRFSRGQALLIALTAVAATIATGYRLFGSPATALMPHGMCFLWSPDLIWSNVMADALIAVSYIAIAGGLVHLVLQNQRHLPFHWMFLAFASFILACGATHVLDIVTLWLPAYWLSTALKFVTAGASAITAFSVPIVVMRATVALLKVEQTDVLRAETQSVKDELHRQTIARATQLARANADLERTIAARMAEPALWRLEDLDAGTDDAGTVAGEPAYAGVAIVTPDSADEVAHSEAIVHSAATYAREKQRKLEEHRLAEHRALTEAREICMMAKIELEHHIDSCTRASSDEARYAATTELARINVELTARLAERTVEIERLNASLADQLRSVGRAYDDLESYATALRENEARQRAHAQQLRSLHAIASAATSRGIDEVEAALRLVLESLEMDWGFFARIDERGGELVIERSLGGDDVLVAPAGSRARLSATVFGARITDNSKAVMIVDDAEKLAQRPAFGGWRTGICVPLSIGGRAFGMIGFTSRACRAEPFSQANIEFLAVSGELISAAIERRIKAEQLEESEARYRALADAMPQLVWLLDANGRLAYANARWSAYTGQHLTDDRDVSLSSFFEDPEAARMSMTAQAAGTTEADFEGRLRRADGTYRWHLIRSHCLSSSGSSPTWIVTAIDTEERKASELLNAAAHAAALAATESKSRFLATMSHEIRTPMNGIVGMTELLLLTSLDTEQREYAQVVHDSGRSLLRVIDDILDYSKIEAGKVDIETLEFDLPKQIESVVDLLNSQFAGKGVSLTTRLQPGLPQALLGDPGRLRQVLINLAGNALKFTPPGGRVVIDATATSVAGRGSLVRLSVSDTGIGIPPQVVEKLFTPFTQGDSSTTRRFGGTGLGLSICAQLVALMGGTIGVESTEHVGSTFWFEIPFAEPAAGAPVATTEHRDTLPADGAGGRRNERILVVDDNVVNILLATKQFARLGFTVATAAGGRECLDMLARETFDLIFMDCQMPEMDGFETTAAIRRTESESAERIPIVAMTADAREEDRQRCLACGMDDYVSKPTDLQHLKAIVDRWLPAIDRRAAQRQPTALKIPTHGFAALIDLFDGDRGAVAELLNAAVRTIRVDVARIERAAVNRDRDEVRQAAHRLRGTSGSIRFVPLAEIAGTIAALGHADPWNVSASVLIALREASNTLNAQVARFTAENDVPATHV